MAEIGVPSLLLFTVLSVSNQLLQVSALECIQCDRHGQWYSPEETERHVARCQSGMIEATSCSNASHTHCIYSYYRQGVSSTITVTERRCGVESDILGCTLYKSNRRRLKRHFLHSDTDGQTIKRRETNNALFVEVCTEGCQGDGCVNGSSRTSLSFVLGMTGLLLSYFIVM